MGHFNNHLTSSLKTQPLESKGFRVLNISELDQQKFALVTISDNRYLYHEERALVRNFELTCYYVAPILPAQLPAQFSAEQAVKAGKADNAELETVRFP